MHLGREETSQSLDRPGGEPTDGSDGASTQYDTAMRSFIQGGEKPRKQGNTSKVILLRLTSCPTDIKSSITSPDLGGD